MNSHLLLSEAATYVQQLYKSCKRTYLLYHNIEHTSRVVAHSKELLAHYKLGEQANFELEIAAWFHDTGQLTGELAVHEETSVQFMKDFFYDRMIDKRTIEQIGRCILATKMPVAPTNISEEIICDADTWHLGTSDFHRLDVMVWKELELRFNKPIEHQIEKSIQFLESHKFYTGYCIEKLTEGKNKNIALLKSML